MGKKKAVGCNLGDEDATHLGYPFWPLQRMIDSSRIGAVKSAASVRAERIQTSVSRVPRRVK